MYIQEAGIQAGSHTSKQANRYTGSHRGRKSYREGAIQTGSNIGSPIVR